MGEALKDQIAAGDQFQILLRVLRVTSNRNVMMFKTNYSFS